MIDSINLLSKERAIPSTFEEIKSSSNDLETDKKVKILVLKSPIFTKEKQAKVQSPKILQNDLLNSYKLSEIGRAHV